MIASARGLIALSVVAAVLAAIVALDRGAAPGAADRRLVPGLDAARVDEIAITGGDGTVQLVKDGDTWRVIAPAPGPADAAVVRDLLGALAAARWEREVDDAPAWTDTRAIALATGRAHTIVQLGPELPGAQQAWARVDGGPALLVPSWLATAAARDAAAVHDARLVHVRPDQITGLELHGRGVDLVVSGLVPIARGAGFAQRVRPDAMAALDAALVALHASSYPARVQPAPPGPDALTIRVLGGTTPDEVDAPGPCPRRAGQTLVEGTASAACVADAQLDAVVAAARPIASGAAVDPSPLRAAPITKLVLPAAIVLARGGGFTVQASAAAPAIPADDDAVHELFAALSAPATLEPLPPGALAPSAMPEPIRVDYGDGGHDELRVVSTPTGPGLVRGRSAPLLKIGPAAQAAVRTTVDDLRDRGLLSEEPTALAALDVTAGAHHGHAERGATTGDWTGDLDGVAVLGAADVIAHLRAARFIRDADVGATRVAITATFAAPPIAGGKPAVHAIAIGAERPDGCAARVDGHPVVLDLARCAALASLAPAAAAQ